VLHTNSAGEGPTSTVTPRPEILRLAGGSDLTVHMWVLTPETWEDLLVQYGLRVQGVLSCSERCSKVAPVAVMVRVTSRPP
jgi:hypothetical protein